MSESNKNHAGKEAECQDEKWLWGVGPFWIRWQHWLLSGSDICAAMREGASMWGSGDNFPRRREHHVQRPREEMSLRWFRSRKNVWVARMSWERLRLRLKLSAGTRSGQALKTTARSLGAILSTERRHWHMCGRAWQTMIQLPGGFSAACPMVWLLQKAILSISQQGRALNTHHGALGCRLSWRGQRERAHYAKALISARSPHSPLRGLAHLHEGDMEPDILNSPPAKSLLLQVHCPVGGLTTSSKTFFKKKEQKKGKKVGQGSSAC